MKGKATNMKALQTYNRSVQYLNKVMKLVNTDFFNGELEGVYTITIQSTVGAYGHVTTSKVWRNERGEATYELNIGADYLSRPIENIVATLIHEGCHIYAMLHDIKDTSNRGVYHNKRFKALAEERALIIEKHDKYGWTITSPSDSLIEWCIDNDLQDILVTRQTAFAFTGIGTPKAGNGAEGKPIQPKKRSSSIKWVCPCCGAIVRSTRVLNIMCGDCNEQFIEA